MKSNTKDLGHGITLIDAEYGQSGVAGIYLMEQDGEVAIIETGTNHSVPYVAQALKEKDLSFDHVRYIIPTHVHLDHAGGAGELMHQCHNAQLVVHPFGTRHLVDPSKLEAGTIAVYGEEKFRKLYGKIRPIDASRVIEAPGFFKLKLSGRKLKFFDTPGHARHHFCIYDKQSNGIFTGDTFGVSYPQITTKQGRFIFATTTPVQFDPGSLLQSIDCLTSLNPNTMYLTHFGAITPSPEVIKQLRRSVRKFSNIALELQTVTENRVELIQQALKQYLLDVLKEMECEQSPSFCEEVIEFDTLLNAQGLDFWLSKSA
jgi:glyoxylase-like metal-dependent hydrolase (beta-lactamase superfamily II)